MAAISTDAPVSITWEISVRESFRKGLRSRIFRNGTMLLGLRPTAITVGSRRCPPNVSTNNQSAAIFPSRSK
ncbi:hypothetical protein GCM10009634_43980 [Saccharothrix xinjiangensis]